MEKVALGNDDSLKSTIGSGKRVILFLTASFEKSRERCGQKS
jgi:hypothetical protein